jgi:hypothetical protein
MRPKFWPVGNTGLPPIPCVQTINSHNRDYKPVWSKQLFATLSVTRNYSLKKSSKDSSSGGLYKFY